MRTSQSPRAVLITAYQLAARVLPGYSCKFSRHDFTLAQLFACLVLREFYKLSFRRVQQLLADSPEWLSAIGLPAAPDHNTLWRASNSILKQRRVERLLDLLAEAFVEAKLLKLSTRPLSIDSTCFEPRHRSMHYDRRCRQLRERDGAKTSNKPGSWGASVNAARQRTLNNMPKLSLAVASGCHLILALKVRSGNGSDAPDFDQLLYDAWRRAPVKTVVADAGYDSEANHCIARQDMNVKSIIALGIGRPTHKLPRGRWRRLMAKRAKRKADRETYRQRNQSETANSMIKRNLGSALRAKTAAGREKEMMMRALTHNIMLLLDELGEG